MVRGRDEPRDFLDVLYDHEHMLPFAGLLWAAVGKDPDFTPLSLLELARRRGRYQNVDFERLHLLKTGGRPSGSVRGRRADPIVIVLTYSFLSPFSRAASSKKACGHKKDRGQQTSSPLHLPPFSISASHSYIRSLALRASGALGASLR